MKRSQASSRGLETIGTIESAWLQLTRLEERARDLEVTYRLTAEATAHDLEALMLRAFVAEVRAEEAESAADDAVQAVTAIMKAIRENFSEPDLAEPSRLAA